VVVYFSTATNRRSRGASWSIIAPPFIPGLSGLLLSLFLAPRQAGFVLLGNLGIFVDFIRGVGSPAASGTAAFSPAALSAALVPLTELPSASFFLCAITTGPGIENWQDVRMREIRRTQYSRHRTDQYCLRT
jgi:hypothetical protein